MGNKPSAPATPDYAGAAKAQGAANVDAAVAQGKINNPNVVSPYGTQNVTYGTGFDQAGFDQAQQDWNAAQTRHQDRYGIAIPEAAYKEGYRPPTRDMFTSGDPYQATLTQQFSPEQQALYTQQTGNQLLLGGLGTQGINAAQGIIGQKVDYSGAPAMPGSYDTLRNQVYDAMMKRPNEDTAVRRDETNSNLVAAGIRPGTPAYDNMMRNIDRQQVDAQQQAVINAGNQTQQAYGMDLQSRQQGLNEYNAQRSIPLNEITALMSGSQVSSPFSMPGYAQNASVAAAPVYGAAQDTANFNTDLYNQQAAQQGNLQSGLFGLGGSVLQAGGMAMGAKR